MYTVSANGSKRDFGISILKIHEVNQNGESTCFKIPRAWECL